MPFFREDGPRRGEEEVGESLAINPHFLSVPEEMLQVEQQYEEIGVVAKEYHTKQAKETCVVAKEEVGEPLARQPTFGMDPF
ncbi:hypothetical protein L1987_03996 [Smallanthus sonchifolius]|uniref:Uncharacterized protein n=1 Tax=Smallanthus sonchifolius TaxID=185202 RepID=A0ACB9KC53_9ASTR|nr:hypothetical protein L1987_03996 [Smallanthus sonchifolius]